MRDATSADLQRLVNHLPDALAVIALESGRIRLWNRAAERLFGYSAAEAYELTAEQLLVERFRPVFRLALAQISANPERAEDLMRSTELPALTRDGEQRLVEVSTRLLDEPGTEGRSIVVSMRDITARRQMEERLHVSEAGLSQLLDTIAEGLLILDREGRIVRVNAAAERVFGSRREDLLGKYWNSQGWRHLTLKGEPLPPEQHPFSLVQRAGGPVYQVEWLIEQPGGKRFFISSNAAPLQDAAGGEGAIISFADVSERVRAEQSVRDANNRLSYAVGELEMFMELSRALQGCLGFADAAGAVERFAPRLFPDTSGVVVVFESGTLRPRRLAAWGTQEGQAAPRESCPALRSDQAYVAPHGSCCRMGAGSSVTRAALCVPLIAQNEKLGVLSFVAAAGAEISSARQRFAATVADQLALALVNLRLRETLRNESIRDPLTGLYNRRHMEASLQREVHRAERQGTPLSVLMLDLDHFKPFNDTFGHAAGDAMLRELAQFLQAHIREEDIACRYGGEEFLLILPGAAADTAYHRAVDLLGGVKRLHVQIEGRSLASVSGSIGIACFPFDGETADALILAADAALYHAKRSGRDRAVRNFRDA